MTHALSIQRTITSLLCAGLISLGLSSPAHADIFGLWIKPKVDYINGSGEVFKRFEGSPAYGIEAGVELLSISIWADYEKVGDDQYWGSGNVGYDLDIELIDDLTFMAGGYVGLILFGFPEVEGAGDELKANEEYLKSTLGDQYDDFVDTYNTFQSAEQGTSNMAYGANARVRLSLEYELLPFVSIGAQWLMGWHFVLSGEEAASGFKAQAIDSFVSDQEDKLPDGSADMIKADLKSRLGAEDIDTDNLKGTHYTAGAFLSVRF